MDSLMHQVFAYLVGASDVDASKQNLGAMVLVKLWSKVARDWLVWEPMAAVLFPIPPITSCGKNSQEKQKKPKLGWEEVGVSIKDLKLDSSHTTSLVFCVGPVSWPRLITCSMSVTGECW